ncbi:MAG: T9SS type A sorting domain-containing protein [Saprospiraceae bacterium]|nr:T9SS type A sorting domain-containing protein [Saprospiraceae bacterium]
MKALFCVFLFLPGILSAQESAQANNFVDWWCPENAECLTSSVTLYHTYSANDFWGLRPEPDIDNCGHTPNAQQNFMFEAMSREIEVIMTWDAVPTNQLQMGIMSGCKPFGTCIAYVDCEDNGEMIINVDDLVVGHEYIFYIDGCTPTDFNNIEVDITPGPTEDFSAITEMELNYASCPEENPENQFCKGTVLELTIGGPNEDEIEYFLRRDAIWKLSLDGPVSESFELESIEEFELNLSVEGDYVLILESVVLSCEEYGIDAIYEFQIGNINEQFGTYNICEHDLVEWNPGEGWLGPDLSEDGYHQFWYENECGCPYYQDLTIDLYEEDYSAHELVLCPDDYPYEFYDGYIIDYRPYDYEEFLRFDNGSLVEDYDNNNCDSLIHLMVVNESPENRCASCVLPLILEDAHLIVCIPFDNASYDVSGNANIVEAIGVNYDNNFSDDLRLWEALLDGNNDYIEIKHTPDLNSNEFAIDIQFNKDRNFRYGPIETILHKGDDASNTRYTVYIEEDGDDHFFLHSLFYTPSGEVAMEAPRLNTEEWYGATYVIQEDSILMYLTGEPFDVKAKTKDLRGNDDPLFLGTKQIGPDLSNFYRGRLDNFRYWRERLAPQDVLYLYYPEKQFQFEIDMYLTCCETGEFRGVQISANTPKDTLIPDEQSPTGYDSIFYLNYAEITNVPTVDESLLPEDVITEAIVGCNEFCSTQATWAEPPAGIFSDLCGIKEISSSHVSPVQLDENISYVEVTYTAENECGYMSSFSFGLELICTPEDYESLPDNNGFELKPPEVCDNQTVGVYCIGQNVLMYPFALDSMDQVVIGYGNYENLILGYNVDGIGYSKNISEASDLNLDLGQLSLGKHDICYEYLKSECDEQQVDLCITIEVVEALEIDHGVLAACHGEIEAVLPLEISSELRAQVLQDESGGSFNIAYSESCGCEISETIELVLLKKEVETLEHELCPSDFPLEIMGQQFHNDQEYNEETIVFPHASKQSDSNGMFCDSLVALTINVLDDKEVFINVEICEGEEYMGLAVAGSYVFGGKTTEGCDSTTVIDLFVLGSDHVLLEGEICPGEEWEGYTEDGIYIEAFINQMGCDSIVTYELSVLDESDPACNTTSIEELNGGWIIYPNPVTDKLFVKPLRITSPIDVAIYNFKGQLLYKQKSFTAASLDVINITPGLIYLVLENNETRRVIPVVKY